MAPPKPGTEQCIHRAPSSPQTGFGVKLQTLFKITPNNLEIIPLLTVSLTNILGYDTQT